MRADLRSYADAIEVLQQHAVKALSALTSDTKERFQKAQRLAERSRLAYEHSRAKLAEHVASHGCE